MLNILNLYEVLFKAMDAFSSRNNGIEGIMIEDITEEVIRLGGDGDDLVNATVIYTKLVITDYAKYLN